MEENITITVLMPVYNAEKYLKDAIESILNQTYTDFEFLIFDDCSTDNSLKIIQSYNDSRIKLFISDKNQGYLIYLNKGIELAKGKYIARMDADDISLPTRFEEQINFLEKNPQTAILGTDSYYIDNNNNPRTGLKILDDNLFARLFFYNCFIHTSIMGKTELFRKFKYNNSFYLAEDYLLWSQIGVENKIDIINKKLIKYRIHNSSVSVSYNNKQEDVVKEIFTFHLKLLKIKNISNEVIQLHYNLLRNILKADLIDTNQKNMILKWIIVLRKHNNKYKIYNKQYFNNQLQNYWNKYFHFLENYKTGINALPLTFDYFNRTENLKAKIIFALRCILNKTK